MISWFLEGGMNTSENIAVIGIDCVFPGSENKEAFWHNLIQKRELISEIEIPELIEEGISAEIFSDQAYVKKKGIFDGLEFFDNGFFGYSAQESNVMDPQFRLLHQSVYHALEDAKLSNRRNDLKIGLFCGSSSNAIWVNQFLSDGASVSDYQLATLNERDFLTTRISHKLNLTGPSVNIQSACSTSLVAIHEAVKSLFLNECDVAIAGGVSVTYPFREGYLWHEGMIFSRDGTCRPFDKFASGTVPGNGVGLIVLKPLDKARKDKDRIYAVIKGSSINNDGNDKVGYTAPGFNGQINVIKGSIGQSAIDVNDIDYIETHGTGTSLGDPIEFSALCEAFKDRKNDPISLGAVKANIGHLDAAAGIAGLIKATLACYYRQWPGQINFDTQSENIDFHSSPFKIERETKNIDKDSFHIGVSSFGIGGTNCHVILGNLNIDEVQNASNPQEALYVFSAKSKDSLDNYVEEFLSKFGTAPNRALENTLIATREQFTYRKCLLCNHTNTLENTSWILPNDTGHKDKNSGLIISIKAIDDATIFGLLKSIYSLDPSVRIFSAFKYEFVQSMVSCGWDIANLSDLSQLELAFNKDEFKLLAGICLNYSLIKCVLDLNALDDVALFGQGIGEVVCLAIAHALPINTVVEIAKKHEALLEGMEPGELIASLRGKQSANSSKIVAIFSTVSLKPETFKLFHSNRKGGYKSISFEEHLNHLNVAILLKYLLGNVYVVGGSVPQNLLASDLDDRFIDIPYYKFDNKPFNTKVISGSTKPKIENTPSRDIAVNPKEILEGLWFEELGVKDVDPDDNFFELGGDSLAAIALISGLKSQLGLEIGIDKFNSNATFSQLLELLECNTTQNIGEAESRNDSANESKECGLSFQQRQIYSADKINNDTSYNLSETLEITGPIDIDKLVQCVKQIIDRHPALRTILNAGDPANIKQIVTERKPEAILVSDTPISDSIQFAQQKFFSKFDLEKGPLFKVQIFKAEDEKHFLLIDIHHIIADQISISIILDELSKLYNGDQLEELASNYFDYVYEQKEVSASGDLQRQIDYYVKELSDCEGTVGFPTDRDLTQLTDYSGGVITRTLTGSTFNAIQDFCKARGVTPYVFFAAALNLIIYKYTGKHEIIIGTAMSGRYKTEYLKTVGMFSNTLCLKNSIEPDSTINQLFSDIQNKVQKMFENKDCLYDDLVREMKIIGQSRNTLFEVLFNFVKAEKEVIEFGDVKIANAQKNTLKLKSNIGITIEYSNDCFKVSFEYVSKLFDQATIEKLADRFIYLAEQLPETDGERNLSTISFPIGEPCKELSTLRKPQNTKTIFDILDTVFDANENNIAIKFEDSSLTYGQLKEKVHILSNYLLQKGVEKGKCVALRYETGFMQIVSSLAVIQIGAAYVPLSKADPDSKVQYILDDSSATLLLSDEITNFKSLDNILLKFEDLTPEIAASAHIEKNHDCDNIFCIIYTSGSTGVPKGVRFQHKNLISVITDVEYMTGKTNDAFLQMANFAFDGSLLNIYMALFHGATLILICSDKVIEPSFVERQIKQHNVTKFFLTTALFNMLVDHNVDMFLDMDQIMFGGESASPKHVNKFVSTQKCKLVNCYGPTETCIIATTHQINKQLQDGEKIPIGKNIEHVQLFVIDENRNVLGEGLIGELCISGYGVTQGYVGLEDKNQEKFIKLDEAAGTTYLTGDIAKITNAGEIEFLGRRDNQVKVRGYRVELNEIQTKLRAFDYVDECIVILSGELNNMLVAFVCSNSLDDASLIDQISNDAKATFPRHEVPKFIPIEKLPLTPNGKVDTKKLLNQLEVKTADNPPEHVGLHPDSENDLEWEILKCIRTVVQDKSIKKGDNFFDVGGHSIRAIELVSRINKLGHPLLVNNVFDHPSAEKLAAFIMHDYNAQATSKRQEISDPEIQINISERQIDAIVQSTKDLNRSLRDFINSTEVLNTVNFLPIHRFHAQEDNRVSGIFKKINIPPQINAAHRIAQIIVNQELLCATIEGSSFAVRDLTNYTKVISQFIPVVNIENYSARAVDKLLKAYKAYIFGKLDHGELYKICVLKNRNEYTLFWAFDHLVFDLHSSNLIESELRALNDPKKPEYSIRDYQNILNTLSLDVPECEIIDKFKLREFVSINDRNDFKLGSKHGHANRYIAKIPLDQIDINYFDFAIENAAKIICQYLDIDAAPFLMVDINRDICGKNFSRNVCELLDLIPILYTPDTSESVATLTQYSKSNNIHFLNTCFDGRLSEKYADTANLLGQIFSIKRGFLMLFNFQGFLNRTLNETPLQFFNMQANDVESQKQPPKAQQENSADQLNRFFINTNYDEEYLSLVFTSLSGLNESRLDEIANQVLSKDDQYEKT